MLVWKSAREQAEEVLAEHWDGILPVDPFKLAQKLGIAVYVTDLGRSLAGEIVQNGPGDARINLSNRDPEVRQAFTCAHEIGHFIERNVVAADPEYSFSDERDPSHYDLNEFFADEFAGALLMPEGEIAPLIQRGVSPIQIAKHFGVSVPAAVKREERLKKHGATARRR